ncbi:Peptidase M42 family protein [Algoriphagus sanaruensis]|uniref:Peptidase M42 family protein n=1 Tax=Algoriphagus sanaruensis TaxID=1727163 RepID=A0A142EQE5_9BACT|nr:Peptidase M42 family protein [Algoriphagus sanaruensis]
MIGKILRICQGYYKKDIFSFILFDRIIFRKFGHLKIFILKYLFFQNLFFTFSYCPITLTPNSNEKATNALDLWDDLGRQRIRPIDPVYGIRVYQGV